MQKLYSFIIVVHNCLLGIYHGTNFSWLFVGMTLKYLKGKGKKKIQFTILNIECKYANLCGLVSSIPIPISFCIRKQSTTESKILFPGCILRLTLLLVVGNFHDRVEGTFFSAEGQKEGVCHCIFQGYPEEIWKWELNTLSLSLSLSPQYTLDEQRVEKIKTVIAFLFHFSVLFFLFFFKFSTC